MYNDKKQNCPQPSYFPPKRKERGYLGVLQWSKVVKKRFMKILLTAATAVTLALGFTACSGDGEGLGEYDHLVTFNYNIGELDANCPDQYLGVMTNSLVGIQPGYSDAFKFQEVIGYYNEGWYLAEVDGEGNPVVDEDGRVQLGDKWDFATDRVTENVTLYANMLAKPTLVIKGGDADAKFDGIPGDIRKEPSSALMPKKAGATFYGYFEDEACTQPFAFPYTFEDGEKIIYAKFIDGVWLIVDTVEEFKLALAGDKNIYLEASLDFSEKGWSKGLSYSGEINGNGNKLTGISVTYAATQSEKTGFGLFGTLKETAFIHDLIIEDATAVFNTSFALVDLKAALFVYKAEEGARLQNVTVTGNLSVGTIAQGADVTLIGAIAEDDGAEIENCNFTEITVDSVV